MANEINSIIKVEGIEMAGNGNNEDSEKESKEKLIESFERPQIRIRDIDDYITFEKSGWVPSTDAATAGLYPVFYIANLPCFVVEARERHGVVGGSSAKVNVEKLVNGIAKGSGSSVIAGAFDLTAVANTIQRQNATTVLAAAQLRPGDALALRPTGTLTGAENVIVTVLLGIELKNLPTGRSVTTVIIGI